MTTAAYLRVQVHRAARRVHPWRVLHAATASGALLEAVALQSAVGMRPEVVTPEGVVDPDPAWAGQGELLSSSLMSAWHDVRSWRDVLMRAAPSRFELIHAHSFSSGMAAVRNCPVVVYDVNGFVEQLALEASEQHGLERPGAWLSRSLRVAEQFVIARAGAIIVHTAEQRSGAVERGAEPDKIFLVPLGDHCLDAEEIARRYDEAYHHASAHRDTGTRNRTAVTLAPSLA